MTWKAPAHASVRRIEQDITGHKGDTSDLGAYMPTRLDHCNLKHLLVLAR